ncbi:D-alanyl-D-alanine carboxypeptidase family protein [Acetivibrio cellulolyticus]|uniref:D-alanyl-D-alanine carboxypeptidase family protein n=1 Tax=Acetivibrio cellulolyticus TaxID=35830 RepID=UPI0001E30573|nr:D-alanyl-D-alanine carboxypeptidase family protein [Acetivibrio cellulolyticus]
MKKLFIGIIMFTILNMNINTAKAEPLNIDAKAYILIDSKTGQVISEYNADQKLYPASTTKIMTAIIGIENADPEQLMTVSQYAINNIGPGGMNIGLLPGEQLKFKDVLNALLVRSANETAYVIAENVGPTPEAFFAKMNQRAKELACTNTNFVNPCGMDTDEASQNHLTTARDLSLMAKHAMTLPLFKEIVKKTSCTIPPTNMHNEAYTLPSTNKLFYGKYSSKYYNEVTGIKTGYTVRASFNLVSSAKNEEGMELISVILGCPNSEGIYQSSKDLLEYGFKNYSMQNLIAANSFVTSVRVADASYNPNLNIVAAEDLKCILPNEPTNQADISEDIKINKNITAPIKEGAVLGSIEYKQAGISIGKVNLVASRNVERILATPTPPRIITSFGNSIYKKVLLTIFAVIIGFLALRTILRKISRNRRLNRF